MSEASTPLPPASAAPRQASPLPASPVTANPPALRLATLDYSVLQQCMHCGLCLPACPTYAETGRERHSPRGRISLMRAVADGELPLTDAFAREMAYCVACLACTSACPAGVDYSTLIETARADAADYLDHASTQTPHDPATPPPFSRSRRILRALFLRGLFTRPRALRALGRALRLLQASGLQTAARRLRLTALLPARLREMEDSTPAIRARFSNQLIAPVETPGVGSHAGRTAGASTSSTPAPRFRVALLTGCVQDLVLSEVNRATADVLLANGCEVHTPPVQPCCGSLHAHNGDLATARTLARRQIDLLPPQTFDAIISNAGGCGSHLRHYGRLLADDPAYAARAAAWDARVRDISEWLVEIGFRAPASPAPAGGPTSPRTVVTYQESCHLCHGQRVSVQPRALLRSIPGVELREAADPGACCGSAGIYSLTHPETAARMLARKLGHLQATGAAVIATGNPGCHLHLEKGLRLAGGGGCTGGAVGDSAAPRVVHTVVLLAGAYRADPTFPS